MAGHDPTRVDAVMDWPLRDLFLAFAERMRQAALERYRVDLLVWAVLAPYQKREQKPPRIPEILK
ncbi:MAG: hypothetical protein ACRD4R_06725 [Candidatus Acidiferrales bacterium]